MTNTTKAVGDRLPCGMVSLKMFKIPHSKALIIAYLDLRSGPRMKAYTFNATDISNQTNIGKTVVRQYLKELVAESVLKRKGKSFYQLDRHTMEESYYRHVSESDTDLSESDTNVSETDTNVSESDTDVSESDSIHSSNLHSRKLDSSKLHSTAHLAVQASEQVSSFSSPAQSATKSLTVSGTPPEPLEKLAPSHSGTSGSSVTLAPETSASKTPPYSEPNKEAVSVGQPTATKSGDAKSPAPEKYSPEYWRRMACEQHKNRKLYGSPFGRR